MNSIDELLLITEAFEKQCNGSLVSLAFAKEKKEESVIDLSKADDFTYSAMMRQIRKKTSKEQTKEFLRLFKDYFDITIKAGIQQPEKIALKKALDEFGKKYKLKLDDELIKNAAVTELGNPVLVGKYLSDIIRFTLNRISPERRPKSINTVKQKIYALNENEISTKNLPASSSMGQSITFVKTILFNHNAKYIRSVINNIVRNL